MSKFAAFLAGNASHIENQKITVSNRFKDADGSVLQFEIKALSASENDDLQKRCMVNVPVPGQKGVFTRELDQLKYTAAMLAACVVFPALDDAELQDSYGVKTPEDLLRVMLYAGEYNVLAQAVTTLNRGETLSELVKAAKN